MSCPNKCAILITSPPFVSCPRLEASIVAYRVVLDLHDSQPELVAPPLLRAVGDVMVDKLRFRGASI